MNEEPANESEHSYLLWDCFVNWSLTLEKIEKNQQSMERG